MRLYNHSKIPDNILEPILRLCARKIGADHKKAIVFVHSKRKGAGNTVSGRARPFREDEIRYFVTKKDGWIVINEDTIDLRIPQKYNCTDNLIEVCLHEWVHIMDFQSNHLVLEQSGAYRREHNRRMKYTVCPVERRAIRLSQDALDKWEVKPWKSMEKAKRNLIEWYEENLS